MLSGGCRRAAEGYRRVSPPLTLVYYATKLCLSQLSKFAVRCQLSSRTFRLKHTVYRDKHRLASESYLEPTASLVCTHA